MFPKFLFLQLPLHFPPPPPPPPKFFHQFLFSPTATHFLHPLSLLSPIKSPPPQHHLPAYFVLYFPHLLLPPKTNLLPPASSPSSFKGPSLHISPVSSRPAFFAFPPRPFRPPSALPAPTQHPPPPPHPPPPGLVCRCLACHAPWARSTCTGLHAFLVLQRLSQD